MAKKNNKSKKSVSDNKKESANVPGLDVDSQKKLDDIKKNLESLKDKLVAKFEGNLSGLALLPPSKDDEKKEKVNVLVVIDDSDSKKMSKDELRGKVAEVVSKMAESIKKSFNPLTVLVTDIWQNCFDAKYDLMELIANSATVYDTGILSSLKLAEIHKAMVTKKFEKYIVSYVLAGSLVQGRATPESDVDTFVVIDDTDVKKMTRVELKDKLRSIIISMVYEVRKMTGIDKELGVQVYLLTDFWESVKEANPVIFTFLRDGVPLFDRGTFMPWKQLLQMGRIKPSPEAIDMYAQAGDQVLDRVSLKFKEIGMEDFYWAALTTGQAAVMIYGLPPPTPKECSDVLRHLFVKKEKLLEDKHVKILERLVKVRKDLEHGILKKVSGKLLDELYEETEIFLSRMKKLFEEIQALKDKEVFVKLFDELVHALKEVLRLHGLDEVDENSLITITKSKLADKGLLSPNIFSELKSIFSAKKDFDAGKLTKSEVNKLVSNSKFVIAELLEHAQRRRLLEVQKTRVRFLHGSKTGEIILTGDELFLIEDIEVPEKNIRKAFLKDGKITRVVSCEPKDFEDALDSPSSGRDLQVCESLIIDLGKIFKDKIKLIL
ncbi:nucleotidyltransferase domain-containing protein [Candidatus Woesearchaeota archaeon]|nr:nucleotidyltransferase domain-containing protein [Candidatus Woesearchaeota archaeon]